MGSSKPMIQINDKIVSHIMQISSFDFDIVMRAETRSKQNNTFFEGYLP